MTPEQLHLVRASWAQLEPRREQLGALFYALLFELQPALRTMFKGDLTSQGAKLMATFNVVVHQLDNLESMLPTLRELGDRHRELQVTPEQYDTVAQALDQMLVQALGTQATPPLRQAWQDAYARVAGPMKAEPPAG